MHGDLSPCPSSCVHDCGGAVVKPAMTFTPDADVASLGLVIMVVTSWRGRGPSATGWQFTQLTDGAAWFNLRQAGHVFVGRRHADHRACERDELSFERIPFSL